MNKPEADIALIRKYHNGELTPAEKNSLEAKALDDPFLQDALDGFEELGVKEHELLNLASKIDERTATTKIVRPVWGIKQWGIAASIILFIAVGTIYFKQPPKNKTIALNEIQQKEDIPQSEKAKIAPIKSEALADLNPNAEAAESVQLTQKANLAKAPQSYTPEKDIIVEPMASVLEKQEQVTTLEEVRVIGYGTQKKQDLMASITRLKSADLLGAKAISLDGTAKPFTLVGKIMDDNGNDALPGVTVKNLNTGDVTQTDASGNFKIEANEGADLVFNYIGYETKSTTIQNTGSLKIALKQSRASLSELAVVGYGSLKTQTSTLVGPKVGWKPFKNYLEEQAANAKLGRGKVQVEFLINANGELSDFKILGAFTAKAGVAAIDIIKNYNDGWIGSAENIPHKTNITITFK